MASTDSYAKGTQKSIIKLTTNICNLFCFFQKLGQDPVMNWNRLLFLEALVGLRHSMSIMVPIYYASQRGFIGFLEGVET